MVWSRARGPELLRRMEKCGVSLGKTKIDECGGGAETLSRQELEDVVGDLELGEIGVMGMEIAQYKYHAIVIVPNKQHGQQQLWKGNAALGPVVVLTYLPFRRK